METWAIVTLVLGTSAVSALLTFFITRMQVRHSDKRLEKQLESAREADYRQRRREVRGEPLQKLGRQLGDMVTKHEKVVRYATLVRMRSGQTQREWEDQLRSAIRDVNDYIDSGKIDQTLFMLDDKAILDGVRQLNIMIFQAWQDAIRLGMPPMSPEELKKSLKLAERIEAKTTGVQSLINKRLEEL